MALHQILVYGNFKVDPEPEDFLIKDYIFDYAELLKKDQVIEMVNRGVDDEDLYISSIQIVRE